MESRTCLDKLRNVQESMATLCRLLSLRSACHRGATSSFDVKEKEGEGEGEVKVGGKEKRILADEEGGL